MKDPDRDQSIERMLARMPDTASDGCPDAETLAAWSSATLRDEERSRVESHVADCARCQMQLATMTRLETARPSIAVPRQGFRLMPWLVPIGGAVAAMVVWFLVQPPHTVVQPETATPSAPRELELRTEPKLQVPPEKERQQANRSTSSPPPSLSAKLRAGRQAAEPKRERALEDRMPEDVAARAAPPPAPAAAPPAATPLAVQETVVVQEARRADAELFRAANIKVQRSADGTVTWDVQPPDLAVRIVAAASPNPNVIWLVGKGGLVLLSTDGSTWRTIRFPETVDLTAVQASSGTAATVTSADGRTFETSDGGSTWRRR